MNNCWNCAKQYLCKNFNKKEECKDKITFVKANILDKPNLIEKQNTYGMVSMKETSEQMLKLAEAFRNLCNGG